MHIMSLHITHFTHNYICPNIVKKINEKKKKRKCRTNKNRNNLLLVILYIKYYYVYNIYFSIINFN